MKSGIPNRCFFTLFGKKRAKNLILYAFWKKACQKPDPLRFLEKSVPKTRSFTLF
jgi:hypothetical protein